jgi:hypothetical protein
VRVYTFNRLGLRQPLYITPAREADEWSLAREFNVPMLLRRDLFEDKDLPHASQEYYGIGGKSVAIYRKRSPRHKWELIPNTDVAVCDLSHESHWIETSQRLQRRQASVAVDPESGLMLFTRESEPHEVNVSYFTAATMGIGGGEYPRREVITDQLNVVRLRSDEKYSKRKPRNLLKAIHDAAKALHRPSNSGSPNATPMWCKVADNERDCNPPYVSATNSTKVPPDDKTQCRDADGPKA